MLMILDSGSNHSQKWLIKKYFSQNLDNPLFNLGRLLLHLHDNSSQPCFMDTYLHV